MRERMMEREGSKPNAIGAPNPPTTLFSSAKSAIGDKSGC
jgi:hypothetical protein